MKPKRSGKITIALGLELQNSYAREVFAGFVGHAARQKDWEVIPVSGRAVLQPGFAAEYGFDAILINEPEPREIARAHRLPVPVVNTASHDGAVPIPSVMSDNRSIGTMAAEFLLGKGHREFAFCGNRSRSSARERLAGFSRAAAQAGCRVTSSWHPSGKPRDPYEPKIERELTKWLRALPKQVGILAATDRIATQLARLCRQERLAMPGDVSVVGVGQDEIMQRLGRFEITSVVLGTRQIGAAAGQVMEALLAGRMAGVPPVLVAPLRIAEGRSTDVAATNDPVIRLATDFTRANLSRSFGVEEMAKAAGVSRRALERRFAEKLHVAPHEQIRRMRMERQRTLIATTGRSLEEIALETGLCDGTHLSVFFKHATGETPSAFRRRCGRSQRGAVEP